MALSHVNNYYTCKNIKKSKINQIQNCNKLKAPAPTWKDKFELPNGSNSVSDIQDYFGYIIKNNEILTENTLIRIHKSKIGNRIAFKNK